MENQKPTQTDLERDFALRQASTLDDRQFRAFVAGCYTAKLSLGVQRDLVLFNSSKTSPRRADTFTLTDAWFDLDEGLAIELTDESGKVRIIDQEPTELADGVFIWMPRYTMIERVLQASGEYTSRISAAVRLRHNPNHPLIEGSNYLVSEYVFNTLTKG